MADEYAGSYRGMPVFVSDKNMDGSPRDATSAILHRSMERENFCRGQAMSAGVVTPEHLQAFSEERHREYMHMLDRIATALERGNQLTEDVVQHT